MILLKKKIDTFQILISFWVSFVSFPPWFHLFKSREWPWHSSGIFNASLAKWTPLSMEKHKMFKTTVCHILLKTDLCLCNGKEKIILHFNLSDFKCMLSIFTKRKKFLRKQCSVCKWHFMPWISYLVWSITRNVTVRNQKIKWDLRVPNSQSEHSRMHIIWCTKKHPK